MFRRTNGNTFFKIKASAFIVLQFFEYKTILERSITGEIPPFVFSVVDGFFVSTDGFRVFLKFMEKSSSSVGEF